MAPRWVSLEELCGPDDGTKLSDLTPDDIADLCEIALKFPIKIALPMDDCEEH